VSNLFSRILVAIDDSEPSRIAVSLGARLAREHAGQLVLCHVVNWLPVIAELESTGAIVDPQPTIDGLREHGHAVLARAAGTVTRFGVEPLSRLLDGEPAGSIAAFAAQAQCKLIVIGTHGRNDLGSLLLGSTTRSVLRTTALPVLTVRPEMHLASERRRCFERIVVGTDDSEPAAAALQTVFNLPTADRRDVLICSIAERSGAVGQAERSVERTVASARARDIRVESRVAQGSTSSTLVAVAHDWAADLIVLGSHGRRGFERFLLGSVAETVVRTALVPVLVVRTAGCLRASSAA
jgi:nucleotide-binding universal stress UspA family protein